MFKLFKKIHDMIVMFLCEYEMNKPNPSIEEEIKKEIDENFNNQNLCKFIAKPKPKLKIKPKPKPKPRLNQSDNLHIIAKMINSIDQLSEEDIKKIAKDINKPNDMISRRSKKIFKDILEIKNG